MPIDVLGEELADRIALLSACLRAMTEAEKAEFAEWCAKLEERR